MTPDAWACEYLGLWPDALEDSTLVDAWTAAAVPPADLELAAGLVFAVELDEDRETAVIVAAAAGAGGRIDLELLEHRPHGSWLGPRVAELVDRWAPAAVDLRRRRTGRRPGARTRRRRDERRHR